MSVAGRLYLVDTSALARVHLSQVRYTITTLITDRVAATCVTIDLAAGYSGRTAAELSAIEARRCERYVNLPFTEAVADRAREVQAMLSLSAQHRMVGIIDLLTAAVAECNDAVLLHYDAVFEQIGTITGQAHLWVAQRGSLEVPPTVVSPPAPAEPELVEPEVIEPEVKDQQVQFTPDAFMAGPEPAWPSIAPAESPYPGADPLTYDPDQAGR